MDKTPTSKVVEEQGGSETGDGNNRRRDKVFACLICSRCFGYKHVLQNHERIHTGEKPYFCKICDKRFSRGHHLKTHVRLHTGEKPYNCTHCDREFVQVGNLRRHLRVHTGERPYSCDFCPSRFSNSSQLKAHLMIHTGQKPHFCEECCGRFRRRHHRTHHKCTKDNKQLYLLQISRHPPASRGSGSHEKPGGLSGSQVSQLPPPPLLVLTLSSQLFLNKLIPKTYLWDPDMDYEQGISREVTRASVRQSDLIGILSSIQNPPNSTVTRRDVALQTVGTVSMTQTSILPHPKGEKVIRSAAYFSTDYSVQTIM